MGDSDFVTLTKAPSWEEGLVVGSGRVGAVAHGPADALTISLAHERYFLPVNLRPDAPDLSPVISEIRRSVLAGDNEAAAVSMTDGARASGYDDNLIWTDPLGICATLCVRSPHGVASARRVIDPLRGEVAVEWVDPLEGRHAIRILAPRDEETVWLAVESDRASELVVELTLGSGDVTSHDTGVLDASSAVRAAVEGGNRGHLTAEVGSPPNDMHAAVSCDTGAPWRVDGDVVRSTAHVVPGNACLVRIDITTGASEVLRSVASDHATSSRDSVSWMELRALQKRTHGALTAASALDLHGHSAAEYTEDLWQAAREGDKDSRRRVIEVAYLSGRANIISSTGELPATLQGVWQGTWQPAWSADYTLNGNVQNGGIASLIPTGTPELALSLLALILPHLDDYRENARRVHGAEGMLLPSRMSTHGRADHFSPQFPHLFWMGCGGWVLRIVADVVSTTGDTSIVDESLWQLAEGVLRFAETASVVIDGVRRLVPSYSPENTPIGSRSSITSDATIDVAILRDAARATALLGRARGDSSLNARWSRVLNDLPPYRVADDGTLAEWIDPRWAENLAHRHASQLYPLWYEVDPAFDGDDEQAERLRRAAATTVREKIAWRAAAPTAPPGRMEMAFGLAQLGLAAAALGDAEAALTCVHWLAIDHWRASLTTTHDAGRIFNLDASGGLPAVVAAMLLGSTSNTLSVLPACPAAWPRGSVTGLRARGGLIVDRLDWEPGGASLVVRRLALADWLAPAEGTLFRAARGFVLRADGGAVSGERLRIGERSVSIRLDWLPV